MTSEIVGFAAQQQHQSLREAIIRLNGVVVDPAQLQAPDSGEMPARSLVLNADPVSDVQLSTEIADPATRLRALILAALTGRDLLASAANNRPAGIDSSSAPAQSDTTPARPLPDDVYSLNVREQEFSQVDLWVSLSLEGEQIAGGFSYQLSRTDQWEHSLTLEGVRAFIDPLVLNFSGPLRLSGQRTAFDLNADGDTEMIARFASNSYALARDLNANGRIDDGTEVMGALSGDGFAELAQWDANGDGLITADDPVWQTLVLWQPGLEGMQTLASKQVRAVGLNPILSPFTMTGSSGEPLGRINATGYFVAGSAVRSAQQIDLAV